MNKTGFGVLGIISFALAGFAAFVFLHEYYILCTHSMDQLFAHYDYDSDENNKPIYLRNALIRGIISIILMITSVVLLLKVRRQFSIYLFVGIILGILSIFITALAS